ncbi:hypothetical protein CPT03_03180 [Pedobacter ginsengisoli]|uniref:Uncharacterized protein n=1 Tax=Pedobacter ginsengisoli TaxID=363852 RepID=A0A2D1U1Q5_9SPHI|nr:hypothetical protein [Pedobacter ginsengisoli]ATP55533.1 hypothetical protein CPT03_03180 [Pedobacter ginsengisoli]
MGKRETAFQDICELLQMPMYRIPGKSEKSAQKNAIRILNEHELTINNEKAGLIMETIPMTPILPYDPLLVQNANYCR